MSGEGVSPRAGCVILERAARGGAAALEATRRAAATRLLGPSGRGGVRAACLGCVAAGLRGRRRPQARPLGPELLEGRVVPATIPVTSLADAGPGTFRAAIEQADLNPAADTITFAPSVRGAITLSSALPDLSTAIDIEGPGPAALKVVRSGAAGTPEFRIFTVPAGAVVTIAGLTISGGVVATGSDVYGGFGGGISNAGTLTISNCTVSDNSVQGVPYSDGTGGGISNAGTLTISNCTVSDNSAGGIPFSDGTGGGISNSGTLIVTGCTISDNSAAGGYHLILLPGTPGYGYGTGSGGGITNSGSLTVTNSTISGNSASGGSGIGGGVDNSGSLTLTNSTLSGNMASGGVVFSAFGRTLYGTGSGGGIDNSGTLSVIMNIFANPVGGNLVTESGGVVVSHGHNLFSDKPAVSLDPTDLVNTNPLLGPLADNGGPTFTQALLPGSPAIDAGVAVPGVTTDQRGVPRPQGRAPTSARSRSSSSSRSPPCGGPASTCSRRRWC